MKEGKKERRRGKWRTNCCGYIKGLAQEMGREGSPPGGNPGPQERKRRKVEEVEEEQEKGNTYKFAFLQIFGMKTWYKRRAGRWDYFFSGVCLN